MERKYYIIRIGDFYLDSYYLNDESVKTKFIYDVDITVDKNKACKFEDYQDALSIANIIINLGLIKAEVNIL